MNKSSQERIANVVAALEKLGGNPIDPSYKKTLLKAKDLVDGVSYVLSEAVQTESYWNHDTQPEKLAKQLEKVAALLRSI